jgi:hypothetical protein
MKECAIGDTIEFQDGDLLPLRVQRDVLNYVPSPSQMTTWGRSRKPYKFRMNEAGELQRYE